MQDRFSHLKIGSRIDLQIGAARPIRAQVRWQERGGIVGVEFLQIIDLAAMQAAAAG